MNRKEKLLGVFELLMDLMEEPNSDSQNLNDLQEQVQLFNHDVTTSEPTNKSPFTEGALERMKELIDKVEASDENKHKSKGIERIVQMTIRNMKKSEEREANRKGVTLDANGKLVEVALEDLRDEVPTTDQTAKDNVTTGIPTDNGIVPPVVRVGGEF